MAGIASLGRPRHSFARQAKAGIASLGRPRKQLLQELQVIIKIIEFYKKFYH